MGPVGSKGKIGARGEKGDVELLVFKVLLERKDLLVIHNARLIKNPLKCLASLTTARSAVGEAAKRPRKTAGGLGVGSCNPPPPLRLSRGAAPG